MGFQEYLAKFEHYVIKAGIDQGYFGTIAWCPIRDGKLANSPLAKLVGLRFSYDRPAVLEYYGLHKRSTAFMQKAQRMFEFGRNGFDALILNFSSIRDDHIIKLAPDLLQGFPEFKSKIIETRFG